MPKSQEMKDIHAGFRDQIMALPAVNGFGIGGDCFFVYLERENEETRRSIPKRIGNYPVTVKIIGSITAGPSKMPFPRMRPDQVRR